VSWPPSRRELEHGTDQPPPRARALVAGPLDFTLAGVDVQRVRLGALELVDRVYMSVRDRNWDTVLPRISRLRIRRGAGDPLVVTFDGRNRAEALDLAWQGTITVTDDARIVYDMVGEAQSDFPYCRIGFCVLHAAAMAAGHPYVAETPGGPVSGVLPRLVAPQMIVDGRDLPLFPACSAIAVDLGGVVARADFEGSLFVMEDQRNWTDASFKTCCTGGTPYPYQARRGQRFSQRVTISATGTRPAPPIRSPRPRRVELDHGSVGAWPALGLGASSWIICGSTCDCPHQHGARRWRVPSGTHRPRGPASRSPSSPTTRRSTRWAS
jgi:D-apionolactonase